jgi:hypothetical protein
VLHSATAWGRAAALVKRAQDDEAPSIPWNLLKGYGGYAGISAGLPMMLGTKTMYHGTTEEAAKNILEQGLLAARGGAPTGATTGLVTDMAFGKPTRESILNTVTNKVHTTAIPGIAKMHTHFATRAPLHKRINPMKTMENALTGDTPTVRKLFQIFKDQIEAHTSTAKGGRVLKLTLPYERFATEFKADPGFGGISKALASITNQDIEPRYIAGSGKRGQLVKELLSKLPGYVKKHPIRLGAGAGLVAGGGYLAYSALRNLLRRAMSKTQKQRVTNEATR